MRRRHFSGLRGTRLSYALSPSREGRQAQASASMRMLPMRASPTPEGFRMACPGAKGYLTFWFSAKNEVARQIAMQTRPRVNMSGKPPGESITKLQKTAATALMSEPTMEMRE